MTKIKKILNYLSKIFFIRLFLFQIAVIIFLKIFGVSYISDSMTLGAMGFITALIGIYSYRKENDKKN